jgi:hypothetical protein
LQLVTSIPVAVATSLINAQSRSRYLRGQRVTQPFDTTTTASHKLNVAVSMIVALEKRGVVSRYQRDAGGRRLLTDSNINEIREYLNRNSPRSAA